MHMGQIRHQGQALLLQAVPQCDGEIPPLGQTLNNQPNPTQPNQNGAYEATCAPLCTLVLVFGFALMVSAGFPLVLVLYALVVWA